MDMNLPVAANNELSVSSQSAGAVAEIQAAYVMALQKERNFDKCRQRVLASCKRPRFAETARYSRKVGFDYKTNQDVFAEGWSIRAAEMLQQEWQNILVRSDTLYEDDKVRKISVTVIDLERNSIQNLSGLVTKTVERKNAKGRTVLSERLNSYGDKVFIVAAYDHEVDLKAAALRSKLMRDCIVRLIPADILEEMLDQVVKTLSNEVTEDPLQVRKRLVDGFASIYVQPEQLAAYLGHSLDLLTGEDIDRLRKVYTAINSGESRWSDYADVTHKKAPETATIDLSNIHAGDPEPVAPREREPGDDDD